MAGKLRIALVGCARTKRRQRAPAAELYTSPLFQRTREYVEESPDYFAWHILSAKRGLVDPDEVLEPYDLALADLTPAERAAWGHRVSAALIAKYAGARASGVDVWFDLYAGSPYRRHLVPELTRAGFRVAVPLAGLRIGQQLAWLNRALARIAPLWPPP
jgi:hypothetical protein